MIFISWVDTILIDSKLPILSCFMKLLNHCHIFCPSIVFFVQKICRSKNGKIATNHIKHFAGWKWNRKTSDNHNFKGKMFTKPSSMRHTNAKCIVTKHSLKNTQKPLYIMEYFRFSSCYGNGSKDLAWKKNARNEVFSLYAYVVKWLRAIDC